MQDKSTPTQDDKGPEAQLKELAQQVLEYSKGDYAAAERLMQRRLKRDPERWADIVYAFTAAVVMERVLKTQRDAIRAPEPKEDRGLKSLAGSLQDKYAKWLLWPLRDGTPLKKATRAQLETEIQHYRAQGKTMLATADWFEMVVKRMEAANAEIAGGAVDGEELHKMYEKAVAKWAA